MTEGTYQARDSLYSGVPESLDDMLRSDKGPHAFRTISEVADELHVPQHVLRFWETRFEQVRPLKRGGGRRYYRPADIELLRTIADLLYDKNYTVKGVQKILADKNHQTQARVPSVAAPVVSVPEQPLAEGAIIVLEPEILHQAEEYTPEEDLTPEPPVLLATEEEEAPTAFYAPEQEADVQPETWGQDEPESQPVVWRSSAQVSAEQPTGYEFDLAHVPDHGAAVVSAEMNAWQKLATETDHSVRVDEVISISENMVVKAAQPQQNVAQSVDAELLRVNSRLRHDLKDILVELEALRARLSA